MLTPSDLLNPSRKSGYDHVNAAQGPGRKPSWRASCNVGKKANGHADHSGYAKWRGPARATPKQAAQDYCDYINAQTNDLTIEDIRNSTRESGFDYVHVGRDHNAKFTAIKSLPKKDGKQQFWNGPPRDTAEEAAQDYCDYINSGSGVTQASFALKSAGHPSAKRKNATPEQQVALDILRDARAKDTDPGVVYLVAEVDDYSVGKIGWTGQTPPECRLGDYQAGNRRPLTMLAKFKGTKKDENALHRKYHKQNVLGEWFRLTDEVLSEFNIVRKKAT